MSTPDFTITADSVDVTSAIKDRLLALRLTDEAGFKSDTLDIKVDDRDGLLAIPRTGAELSVNLGYQGLGLRFMGIYVVDEYELSGPPATMIIRARAANLRASLKAPKTRPWHETTIREIVETIASEHGYSSSITPALGDTPIPHLDQTAESDANLLTRLGRDHDAVSKTANGFLIFTEKSSGRSSSGSLLPSVSLVASQLTSYRMTAPERGKFESVTAHYHDTSTAMKVPVTAGSGTPVYVIKHTYPNANQALSAATTRLDSYTRGLSVLNLTLPGRETLVAETRLTLSGLRTGVSGEWVITRVVHTLDTNGFTSRLDAEVPKP